MYGDGERQRRQIQRSKMASAPGRTAMAVRSGLSRQDREQRYQQASYIRNIPYIEPVQIKVKERKTEKVQKQYNVITLLAVGLAIMLFLIIVVPPSVSFVQSRFNSILYGQHPVTHIEGYFGLSGESKQSLTHIIAVNREGRIVLIVIPPDERQIKEYVMPQIGPVQSDAIPAIEKTMVQGSSAILVQVENNQWCLIVHNGQFVIL